MPVRQSFKQSLNETKDKLNDKDKELWHRHTRFTNPAGNIMRNVRNRLQAEMLTQVHITKIGKYLPNLLPISGTAFLNRAGYLKLKLEKEVLTTFLLSKGSLKNMLINFA